MKKWLATLCSTALIATLLVGCGAQKNTSSTASNTSTSLNVTADDSNKTTTTTLANEPQITETIRVAALNGPTAIGMVKLIKDAESSSNGIHIEIAKAMDEVAPKLAKGELDIAAVPANVASVLYNKNKSVEVLAINTLGVLYLLETGDQIHTIDDLKGKTILAVGKGATPEFVLRHLLKEHQLDPDKDVTLEFKPEPQAVLADLAKNKDAIAMLPQPFATVAQTKIENMHIALDLTKEWDAIHQASDHPSSLVTGVVIARKDFVKDHSAAVDQFLNAYKASIEFVNQNIDEAAKLVDEYGIVKAPIAKKSIPACNLVFIQGADMKAKLGGYLEVLKNENPKSIGGELPSDDFYYNAQ